MITKQLVKKALSLMISAFLLTTSLPMQVLAQGPSIPSFSSDDFISLYGSPEGMESNGMKQLIEKGIVRNEVVEYTTAPVQKFLFSGGEDLSLFGPKTLDYWHGGKKITRKAVKDLDFALFPDGSIRVNHIDNVMFEPVPSIGNNWYRHSPIKLVELQKDVMIDGQLLRKGYFLDITYPDVLFIRTKDHLREGAWIKLSDFDKVAQEVLNNPPTLTRPQILELFGNNDGRYFDTVKTYVSDPVTVVKLENEKIAVKFSNGKVVEYSPSMFEKDFVQIEGSDVYYKLKKGTHEIATLKQTLPIEEGPYANPTRVVLKEGDKVNITNLFDIHSVPKDFELTAKPVDKAFQDSLNRLGKVVSAMEKRLHARFPKYKGMFFKSFVKNDAEGMMKEVEERLIRRAERSAMRRQAGKIIGGVLLSFGVGAAVYFGLTFKDAPKVKPVTNGYRTHRDSIDELNEQMKYWKDKKLWEKAAFFIRNPNAKSLVTHDAAQGGNLIYEMNVLSRTLEDSEVAPEELAEVLEEVVTYQLPSYNPLKNYKDINGGVGPVINFDQNG